MTELANIINAAFERRSDFNPKNAPTDVRGAVEEVPETSCGNDLDPPGAEHLLDEGGPRTAVRKILIGDVHRRRGREAGSE